MWQRQVVALGGRSGHPWRSRHCGRCCRSLTRPHGAGDVRREGPGHVVPTDRTAAAAGGSTERPRRPDRRLRLRRHPDLRRADLDAHVRPPRRPGSALHPLPHHGAVLSHPRRPALGTQPPHRRDGRHHRDRHLGTGLQLAATQHLRTLGGDPQAQRLLDRAVRQVPRGPGLADQPDGSVRQLAQRRRRLRALLRLHRRGDEPVRAGPVQRHHARRAGPHSGGGLSPHRGPDRPHDRLGAAAEGADARQAVLRVLRTRRHACASPRRHGVVGPLPRQVRRRWDALREQTLARQTGARRGAGRRRAHGTPRRDPRLGRHARRPQAGPGPPDGGLRRVPRAHRPPRREARRRPGRARRSSTTR